MYLNITDGSLQCGDALCQECQEELWSSFRNHPDIQYVAEGKKKKLACTCVTVLLVRMHNIWLDQTLCSVFRIRHTGVAVGASLQTVLAASYSCVLFPLKGTSWVCSPCIRLKTWRWSKTAAAVTLTETATCCTPPLCLIYFLLPLFTSCCNSLLCIRAGGHVFPELWPRMITEVWQVFFVPEWRARGYVCRARTGSLWHFDRPLPVSGSTLLHPAWRERRLGWINDTTVARCLGFFF